MNTLGIDIGGTSVKAAVLCDGEQVGVGRSTRYDRPDRASLVRAIGEATAVATEKLAGRAIDAVGICVPGVLNVAGDAVERSVNVPGLTGVPLRELASASGFGSAPVRGVSDVHAAAHDLWVREKLSGRLWVLALGTGVGGIVLDGGVPLRVSGQSSGHFGQVDVSLEDDPPVPVGPDGGRGGLEGYIGLRALQARYGAGLSGFPASMEQSPIRALVRAIRIGHAIYRPQHVRLAGGVALLIAPKVLELQASVNDGLTGLARSGWTLGVGSDLFHAGRGAARLAAE